VVRAVSEDGKTKKGHLDESRGQIKDKKKKKNRTGRGLIGGTGDRTSAAGGVLQHLEEEKSGGRALAEFVKVRDPRIGERNAVHAG